MRSLVLYSLPIVNTNNMKNMKQKAKTSLKFLAGGKLPLKILFLVMSRHSRRWIMFAVGVYTGLYVDQNYDVPKVQNPKEIFEEIVKLIKKD